MIVALMQPYFFPYIGYFDLINVSDKFIVFDTAQYIKQGWINRNRVLHPQQGWQYVIAPVEQHASSSKIEEVRVVENSGWKNKILARLTHLKLQAPFYDEAVSLVERCLHTEERNISRLNILVLDKICEYIGIEFHYQCLSEMSVDSDEKMGPGDWALCVSRALQADKYVNLPGGRALFDPALFKQSGIGLEIRAIPEFVYQTGNYRFEERLSIIDVLMWNSPERVRSYLNSVKDLYALCRQSNISNEA